MKPCTRRGIPRAFSPHLYALSLSRFPPDMDNGLKAGRMLVIRFLAPVVVALAAFSAEAQNLSTVAVAMPETAVLEDRLQLSGTLSAERSARLSPAVDGLVERLRVDAGDVVQAGDVLLELDSALARHALARSKAERIRAEVGIREAERLLAEARRLAERQHVADTELAAREAALALAEAERSALAATESEQAELLERHTLRAPFDGVIVQRLTDRGEWVTRGTPVLELVAIDRVRLDVQAPQERFGDIDADAEVIVRPDTASTLELPGRIIARVPVAGETGARSFLVRILVEEEAHRLLPGTSATASIRLHVTARDGIVQVPADALLRHPDGGYSLFTVDGGEEAVAHRHPVRIGRRASGMVEIVEGLPPGLPVVIRGNERLLDGQRVRVTGS